MKQQKAVVAQQSSGPGESLVAEDLVITDNDFEQMKADVLSAGNTTPGTPASAGPGIHF